MEKKNTRPVSGLKKRSYKPGQLTIELIEKKLDELCIEFLLVSDVLQIRELYKRIRNYADRERRLFESILDDIDKEEKLSPSV